MTELPYSLMIDALNQKSFEMCVDLLWPVLDYKFLKKENVRPIDLKERVSDITAAYVSGQKKLLPIGKTATGTAEKYVEAIRYPFDNGYLPVEKGSRAEKYVSRAWKIINDFAKESTALHDFEDLFTIYLCLSREAFPSYRKKPIRPVSNVRCQIVEEDAELLKELRVFPFEKAAPSMLRAVAKPERQDHGQKNFAYMTNVLLYCGLIQVKREFGEENEE